LVNSSVPIFSGLVFGIRNLREHASKGWPFLQENWKSPYIVLLPPWRSMQTIAHSKSDSCNSHGSQNASGYITRLLPVTPLAHPPCVPEPWGVDDVERACPKHPQTHQTSVGLSRKSICRATDRMAWNGSPLGLPFANMPGRVWWHQDKDAIRGFAAVVLRRTNSQATVPPRWTAENQRSLVSRS